MMVNIMALINATFKVPKMKIKETTSSIKKWTCKGIELPFMKRHERVETSLINRWLTSIAGNEDAKWLNSFGNKNGLKLWSLTFVRFRSFEYMENAEECQSRTIVFTIVQTEIDWHTSCRTFQRMLEIKRRRSKLISGKNKKVSGFVSSERLIEESRSITSCLSAKKDEQDSLKKWWIV